MKIYRVVMISALSQIGFSGSRVAVSLHALELTANPFAIGVVIALYSLCPMLLSIVIGPLPGDLQRVTMFSAGIHTGAKQADAARALVKFITAPAAASIIRKHGLEPG